MKFELPSVVYNNGIYDSVIKSVKSKRMSLGQYLGKGAVGMNKSPQEKEIYKSQQETLDKYEEILKINEPTKGLIVKTKSGKGLGNRKKGKKGEKGKKDEKSQQKGHKNKIDLFLYKSIEDLCLELEKFYAAKFAGNTGVDNHINAILDKLLKEQAIDKDEYDDLYKNIFVII